MLYDLFCLLNYTKKLENFPDIFNRTVLQAIYCGNVYKKFFFKRYVVDKLQVWHKLKLTTYMLRL